VIVSNEQEEIMKRSLSSGEFKVHYHLNGGTHRMDAIVRNRAESELLALLKEVAAVLGLPVHVETHAYGQGGLVEYLDLVFQNKEQIATVMAILSPLLGAPLYFDKIKQSRQQTRLNELNIEKIKLEIKEKEDAATDREERRNQVGKSLELPLEKAPTSDDISQALLARKKIARRRSNYYQALLADSKIDAVGFAPSHNKDTDEKVVPRSDFGNFVIAKSNLEPLVYEGLLLEIVSPVLRSGSIKWRGIFEKKTVSFELQDDTFRADVASQKVQFQNGTTLLCDFEVHQREDDTGEIEIAGYAVTKVHEVKTPHMFRKTTTEEQLNLHLPDLPSDPDTDV
jgi:hypothetical protein